MKCENDYSGALLDFALEELDGTSRREVLFHLVRCEDCRRELAGVYRLSEAASRGDDVKLSESFFGELRDEVEALAVAADPLRGVMEALARRAAADVPLVGFVARMVRRGLAIAESIEG